MTLTRIYLILVGFLKKADYSAKVSEIEGKILSTPFFLYKHEGKFTPASIMLSFLRISGSNYAYDMLSISFLRKF